MKLKNYFGLILLVTAQAAPGATQIKTTNVKTTDEKTAPKSAASALTVKDGTLNFFAIGKPSMLKIHGESSALTGTATQNNHSLTADLEVPLDSFETGMKLRNKHLKEKVFETSKFDKAKLSITKLELPMAKTGEIKDLPFSGKLNLHGVEKDISGTATVNVGDKTTTFSAETNIKMTDFSIQPPEFMGMTIQDQVKVTAKGEAKN